MVDTRSLFFRPDRRLDCFSQEIRRNHLEPQCGGVLPHSTSAITRWSASDYGLIVDYWGEPVAPYDAANRDLASLIDESVTPFTELVDWWEKDDVQRQMRSKIKRHLRASGMASDSLERLASDIVDLAKVRTDR